MSKIIIANETTSSSSKKHTQKQTNLQEQNTTLSLLEYTL